MKTRITGLILAAFIFVTDQIVKYWVLTTLDLRNRGQVEVIDIFNFTYVENHGVSLGMLTADSAMERWLLVAMKFSSGSASSRARRAPRAGTRAG